MRPYEGRRVLLGVTGGIASYKILWLARRLTEAGAQVDVVLTRSAREFVGAVTFEALTGRPVHTELIAEGHALDHIALAKAADAVVVAPATADFISRAASGRSDDLLSACLLATRAPVLIVPAMNDVMWSHSQTRQNTAHLREIGYELMEPDTGPLASPQEGAGPGRMPEPDAILARVGRLLERASGLRGHRVLVTAGPTREALDPVRYISNHSSGKMGVALAEAAWSRGAEVTLIAGPMSVDPPVGPAIHRVTSTAEMAEAVRSELPRADVLVMAAAPADFRPRETAAEKIKKANRPDAIALEGTVDILSSTRDARKPGAVVVGFALETENARANAESKLQSKALDLIVLNDAAEPGAGFGGDTNHVTILSPDAPPQDVPLSTKREVADIILDRVEALLRGR